MTSLFLRLVFCLDITHQPSYLPWLHRFMLTGFIATMKALTSDLACCPQRIRWPFGRGWFYVTVLAFANSVLSAYVRFELPTIPTPTTASPFCHGRFSSHVTSSPRLDSPILQKVVRSRVRLLPAVSPTGLAESSSSKLPYGLVIYLWLLPTFLDRNAVTFGFQASNGSLDGIFTQQIKTSSQTHWRQTSRSASPVA